MSVIDYVALADSIDNFKNNAPTSDFPFDNILDHDCVRDIVITIIARVRSKSVEQRFVTTETKDFPFHAAIGSTLMESIKDAVADFEQFQEDNKDA